MRRQRYVTRQHERARESESVQSCHALISLLRYWLPCYMQSQLNKTVKGLLTALSITAVRSCLRILPRKYPGNQIRFCRTSLDHGEVIMVARSVRDTKTPLRSIAIWLNCSAIAATKLGEYSLPGVSILISKARL